MSAKTPTLPLGAVRAGDGSVVVPESLRADGSVRKPIRIRQGYVPQDEVPKYKPIGQRMREQDAKQRTSTANGGPSAADAETDAVADKLSALVLVNDNAEEKSARASQPQADTTTTVQTVSPLSGPSKKQQQREEEDRRRATSPPSGHPKDLKTELSTINKSLREITKLERFAAAAQRGVDGSRPLTAPQKRKLERKHQLETRRLEIISVFDQEKDTNSKPASSSTPSTLRVIEL